MNDAAPLWKGGLWRELMDWMNATGSAEAAREIAVRYTAPGVVYEEDPRWPDAGTFRGRDAVVERMTEYLDLMHIRHVTVGDVTDCGRLVFAQVRIEMLGEGHRGQAVEFLWTYTVALEGGRVTHYRAWYDPEEAAQAAGLSE